MPHSESAVQLLAGPSAVGNENEKGRSTRAPIAPVAAPSTRLVSLDVVRGLTIAFMVLVNNNGDWQYAYGPLKHAAWNGFTATDLVFPSFLFIMGTSLVFSFEARLGRGESRASLLSHTLRRAAVLFLLGLLVNAFPLFHWHTLRMYGVLQRTALCFLLASILYLLDKRVTSKTAVFLAALLGYWVLMRWVTVPGYGLPGRDIPLLDPSRNIVAYFDRLLFPARRLYETVRDPEGLLSTLPALGTVVMGMLTAYWLRAERGPRQKVFGMFIAGVLSLLAGTAWGHSFPINKKLWTSSFVLFAGGWTLLALAFCYWAVEVKGWKRGWTYFSLVFGTNAIVAYVFSELLASALTTVHVSADGQVLDLQRWIFLRYFAELGTAPFASLCYSISFVMVCFVPISVLYHKKIFIKV